MNRTYYCVNPKTRRTPPAFWKEVRKLFGHIEFYGMTEDEAKALKARLDATAERFGVELEVSEHTWA